MKQHACQLARETIDSIADQTIWLNIAIFLIGAAVIWVAGRSATRHAKQIAKQLQLSEAFIGMMLLGIVTSLPEFATTVSAARIGDASLAGSNLLGGVALQMALLAVVDGIALRSRPLSCASHGATLTGQAVLLAVLAGVASAGVLIHGGSASSFAYTWPTCMAAVYCGGAYALYVRDRSERTGRSRSPFGTRTRPGFRVSLRFLASSVVVLVGGYFVAESASVLAAAWGVSSSAIGVSLVALATSLPEFSTTFAAVRLGSYGMAVGNILGTNALELALFWPADWIYASGPIVAELGPAEIALGIANVALSLTLLAGLMLRIRRTVYGFGMDSIAALAIYSAALWFVYTIA